jgi:hypothetical protein
MLWPSRYLEIRSPYCELQLSILPAAKIPQWWSWRILMGMASKDLGVVNSCVSATDCSQAGVTIFLGRGDGTFLVLARRRSEGLLATKSRTNVFASELQQEVQGVPILQWTTVPAKPI